MKKKILVVDDSALMRRIVCDIIESDERFCVEDTAVNGEDAIEKLSQKSYDAVILDIVMPKLDGLGVLREINKRGIKAKVIMNSTLTKEGANITMDALNEGALEFVHKPNNVFDAKGEDYRTGFLKTLEVVCNAGHHLVRPTALAQSDKQQVRRDGKVAGSSFARSAGKTIEPSLPPVKYNPSSVKGKKIVAIASSTGGPKALLEVIPKLPSNLNAAVLIVQHMPAGFTASLAERLDSMSELHVKEAAEGDQLQKGTVYLAMGGKHMKVKRVGAEYKIYYSDEPTREGVKPCANYMYETLMDSDFEEICCVVMTGMGADGTQGILNLKQAKPIHVIAQSAETCAVYGMPRSIVNSELADEVIPLTELYQSITKNVGVH